MGVLFMFKSQYSNDSSFAVSLRVIFLIPPSLPPPLHPLPPEHEMKVRAQNQMIALVRSSCAFQVDAISEATMSWGRTSGVARRRRRRFIWEQLAARDQTG